MGSEGLSFYVSDYAVPIRTTIDEGTKCWGRAPERMHSNASGLKLSDQFSAAAAIGLPFVLE